MIDEQTLWSYRHDAPRHSGRTTRQIETSPHGAFFVCLDFYQVRALKLQAEQMGRSDLQFITIHKVREGYLKGLNTPVVFDHCCYISRYGYEPLILETLHRLQAKEVA